MPETRPQPSSGGYEDPQEEIADLERRLAEKRAELSQQEEGPEVDREQEPQPEREKQEKDVLREEIQRHVQETPHPSAPVSDDDHQALRGTPQAQQVAQLVEIALEKGVVHAVTVAEQLDDPYLMDRLHDELVDHFYDKLVTTEEKLKDL